MGLYTRKLRFLINLTSFVVKMVREPKIDARNYLILTNLGLVLSCHRYAGPSTLRGDAAQLCLRTIQYAMNIIIFVLLAIVMASVDQSYFAVDRANIVQRASVGNTFTHASPVGTIIGGVPCTINFLIPGHLVCS